jgi:hypothetical protein
MGQRIPYRIRGGMIPMGRVTSEMEIVCCREIGKVLAYG